MEPMRLYSAGIADFERIREDGRIYVDKTDLIYKLTHESSYIFLSRPRRFGKSLLCSTLRHYFQGHKHLFEGLKIMDLEKEWKEHPVLHFDMSACKNQTNMEGVRKSIEMRLIDYEELYGRVPEEDSPGKRLQGLIKRAHMQTGLKVVVILDEYDAPLLEYLHQPDKLEEVRRIMQEFYQYVKVCGDDLQFTFITGITKFSQLSIFSTINNLTNISMAQDFSAICGITKTELESYFDPDVQMLADEYSCSKEEMYAMLRQQYDGYHFGKKSEDIYNPYSIINAFKLKDISNYWFSSGTPSFLFKQMERFNTNILELEKLQVPASQFDVPTEAMVSALPLLYQSGYLTIKGFDFYTNKYTLDFPNAEVKVGFMENFMGKTMGLYNGAQGFAGDFYAAFIHHDIDKAMEHMRSFFAGIPYPDHGNKELDDLAHFEAYYEVLMYVAFSVINCRTYTQVKSAKGRCDLVVFMNDATYVMELKVNGTPEEALAQIDDKGYAIPYQDTDKPIIKIGIAFSQETRTVSGWKVVRG